MDFFGTFVSGPLAGSTFTLSVDNGGTDGGAFIAAGGAVASFVLVMIAVLSPFLVWPATFKEFSEEYGIGPTVLMGIIEAAYCFVRYRSNVCGWKSNFLEELIPGTLFNSVLMLVIMIGTLAYWNTSLNLGIDFGAFLLDVVTNNGIGFWVALLFVGLLQAILPSAAITWASSFSIRKISQRIRK